MDDNPVPVAERRKRKLETRAVRTVKKRKVTTINGEFSDEFLDIICNGDWFKRRPYVGSIQSSERTVSGDEWIVRYKIWC